MGLISFTYENFYQSSPSLPKFILRAVDLTTLALYYHMSIGVRHLWHDFAVTSHIFQVQPFPML
uniref:Succinate dehydrogenase subunit 3 n=1 Tax=Nymphaea colorata TaxID=210225 RepID=A0A5K0VM52_9MAGN